jgi:two-component sensor histidine kinase
MAGMADTAGLVLSELVTNAILHARTPLVVRVRRQAGGLRLEVIDSSSAEPRRRHHSKAATTGRGLDVVEALSQSWGTEPRGEGKLVWAEIAPAERRQPGGAGCLARDGR